MGEEGLEELRKQQKMSAFVLFQEDETILNLFTN